MLTGEYFPYHPKPQPDELLSSWIVRTALGHGQAPYVFCHTVWPGLHIWNRDIDSLGSWRLIMAMAARTGTDPRRAAATTLAAYEGELVERHFSFGRPTWVLRAGVFHRTRKRHGLQFCPACLSEGESFFRREWRLAWAACCPNHGIVLLDRCPWCRSPVIPHRANPLTSCFSCDSDLREAPTSPATWAVAQLHRKAAAMLVQGYGIWGDWVFQRPFLFFDLLHQVLKVLATGPRSARLRRYTADHWGGDPAPAVFSGSLPEIESAETATRHRLLNLAAHLLEGWPWRYVAACADVGLWWSWAIKDMRNVRYAYEWPVQRMLRWPMYVPTAMEVAAAKSYLRSQGKLPSQRNLRPLVGHTKLAGESRRGPISRPAVDHRRTVENEGHFC